MKKLLFYLICVVCIYIPVFGQGVLTGNGPFCGIGMAQLTFSTTSGIEPFTISYSDGTSAQTATGVRNGVPFDAYPNPITVTTTYYLLAYTDSTGFTYNVGFTQPIAVVNVGLPLSASISGGNNPVCYDSSSGSFTVIPTGGGFTTLDSATILASFTGTGGLVSGSNPQGSLIQASNDLLYGLTEGGGSQGNGNLFSYDPLTHVYTQLYEWTGTDGSRPNGDLLQADNGFLYGMTRVGGINNDGVIFSYNVTTNTYSKLFDFNGTNGLQPFGNLIQAHNGLLYGMTAGGGDSTYGVLFSFDKATTAFKDLHQFNLHSGGGPYGSLLEVGDSLLYGMTYQGGTYGYGVIFTYDIADSVYKDTHDFGDTTDGQSPKGNFIKARNGLLYGLTQLGGSYDQGTIFVLNPDSNTYYKLFNFYGSLYGYDPVGSLLQANNGLLYGLTQFGGGCSSGVQFLFDPFNSRYIKMYDFCNGLQPEGSLIQARDSLLYGVTSQGSYNGHNAGIIFSAPVGVFNYNWYLNDSLTTATLLTFDPGYLTTTSTIRCNVTCGPCSAMSDTITIRISPPFNISVNAVGNTLTCSGGNYFQWFLNGDSIHGATGSVYVASSGGTYTVQAADTNGCMALSNPVTISGLYDISSDKSMNIYPNPSAGTWQLVLGSDLKGGEAKVFNTTGQLMYELSLENTPTFITMPQAASGVYLLRITGPGYNVVKKLVKL